MVVKVDKAGNEGVAALIVGVSGGKVVEGTEAVLLGLTGLTLACGLMSLIPATVRFGLTAFNASIRDCLSIKL